MPPPDHDQLTLFDAPQPLTREEAIALLRPQLGQDLRAHSDRYGLTTRGETPSNKGWAGLTLERLLGLSPNPEQAPDFGDWELKSLAVRRDARGALALKGNLTLTMFQPSALRDEEFERSHLWSKTRRLLIAVRLYESPEERRSALIGLAPFDMSGALADELRAEYEALRWLLREQGVVGLTSFRGRLLAVQPRGESQGWSFSAQRPLIMEALRGMIYSPPSTPPSETEQPS
jgi:hypothetical protein